MKIAFLMQDTGTVYGAERATLDLAEGLRGRPGYDVHLLLIQEQRLGLSRSGLREALAARSLGFTSLPTDRSFSWRLVRAIRGELGNVRADVLHAVGYKADVHGGLAAAWGRRVPVVATVHGWLFRADVKERFYGWLDLQSLRRFTKVVALCRSYEELLVRRGIARERIIRIPSGIDAEKIVSRDRAESSLQKPRPFTAGMLGRLSEEKNHEMFLRAARCLLDAGCDARFLIAGEGPLRGRLEEKVRRLGLERSVQFLGYVDRDDFMEEIHALVVCSMIESLPYSVMEAMAWFRPVIATRVGGLPDLVEGVGAGYLVEKNDQASLVRCMTELAGNPDLRHRLGMRARTGLEQRFSLGTMLDTYVRLYHEILKDAED